MPVLGDGCLLCHRRSLLSEGVLPNDLVFTHCEKLRHAVVIGDHEVTAIAPVRVRHGVEHSSECGHHLSPPLEPSATGLGSGGGLEHAIVDEQAHQSVEVGPVRGGVAGRAG